MKDIPISIPLLFLLPGIIFVVVTGIFTMIIMLRGRK